MERRVRSFEFLIEPQVAYRQTVLSFSICQTNAMVVRKLDIQHSSWPDAKCELRVKVIRLAKRANCRNWAATPAPAACAPARASAGAMYMNIQNTGAKISNIRCTPEQLSAKFHSTKSFRDLGQLRKLLNLLCVIELQHTRN